MAIKKHKKGKNTQKPEIERMTMKERPFSKINFIMMGCCIVMIVLGFILMSGGASSDEYGYNPEVFSTRRIVVGPTISFLGFLLMAFAIIYSPRKKKSEE